MLVATGAQLTGIVHAPGPQAPPHVAQQTRLIGSIQISQAGFSPVQQQSRMRSSLDGYAAPALQVDQTKMHRCEAPFRTARQALGLKRSNTWRAPRLIGMPPLRRKAPCTGHTPVRVTAFSHAGGGH